MAANGKAQACISCFRDTKYTCIHCRMPVCNLCSFSEGDEDTDGWIVGKSVGYCENCFDKSNVNTNESDAGNSRYKILTDIRVPV